MIVWTTDLQEKINGFFGNFRRKQKKNNLFTSLADEIKNKIQNEGKNDDFKQYRKKLHYVFNFI